LIASYVAGLPFLTGTLLGDIFYASVFFGAYEWMARRVPVPAKQMVEEN